MVHCHRFVCALKEELESVCRVADSQLSVGAQLPHLTPKGAFGLSRNRAPGTATALDTKQCDCVLIRIGEEFRSLKSESVEVPGRILQRYRIND
jgi:hypothetical protein